MKKGQSIIEVLIAIAIGSILVIAGVGLIAPALTVQKLSGTLQGNSSVGKELLDNVMIWAQGNWPNVSSLATSGPFLGVGQSPVNQYHLITTQSPFVATSGAETVTVGSTSYTRYFDIVDAYRTSLDVGFISPNTSSGPPLFNPYYYDPSSKFVYIFYAPVGSFTSTLLSSAITRNIARTFLQSDWSVGPSQPGPVTTTSIGFASGSASIIYSTSNSLTVSLVPATQTSGTIQSATFDTGVTSGAAFNSIFWRGTQPAGTSVQFQFAVSNSSAGPWTYKGPDGSSATFYTPTGPGIPKTLYFTIVNGFRYFRYAMTLTSNSAGTATPNATSVIVNWSP